MITEKTSIVRNYILDMLELGTLQSGDRLTGAREIALRLDVSFLKVQQALETLCKDGILHTVNRRGTFVQPQWQQRILPENISIFSRHSSLPCLEGLRKIIDRVMPGVRFTHAFPVGALELKTTLHVQKHYAEYMDLSEILEECYPDTTDFFEQPFQGFRMNGGLVGIPFIFSPRVVFYNPDIFKKAGCTEPQNDWQWADFISTIKKLKSAIPESKIVNWHCQAHLWMNFIMRAGGKLIDLHAENPVTIDSPQTIKGLQLFQQMGCLLGCVENFTITEDFLNGEAAMYISERQFVNRLQHVGSNNWKVVPLPLIPGGDDLTTQATDLLCIHKSCTNPQLAKEYIRSMLSQEVQDYIGNEKYGIPIRKSSAKRSLDLSDARDTVFSEQMHKISAEYNIDSPHLADTVINGIRQMLLTGNDVAEAIPELAALARKYRSIWGFASKLATHTV